MSQSTPGAALPSRVLKFDTITSIADEVRRLRRGYTSDGQWSLPQIAWHLALPIRPALQPVSPDATSTAEQAQLKQKFLDPLLASGVMSSGLPVQPGMNPLVDAGPVNDTEIDRFLAALADLDATTQPRVMFGAFGIVSTDEFRAFIRIHSANHLAHLIPASPPRALTFGDEDAVIGDVEQLRRGYEKRGGWSLPQVCWHLAAFITLQPPADPNDRMTPEQSSQLESFLKTIATRGGPNRWQAPRAVQPPADAGENDIERFIDAMRRLKTYPHAKVVMGPLGPAPIAEYRRAHLLHAAHHLGFLVPTAI
jgi:hypothetical protein